MSGAHVSAAPRRGQPHEGLKEPNKMHACTALFSHGLNNQFTVNFIDYRK